MLNLLVLALATPMLRKLGADPASRFVARVYSQERLADAGRPLDP